MRQARERQISIKFRHANLSWFADLADARYRRKDRHQVCGTGEDQILTALRCQGKIAGKLKRIAGYLSRVDHQGLLGYRMAVPFGVRGAKPVEWPPLAFGKTARIVADLKQVQAEVKVRLGVVWLQLDGPLIVNNRLIGLAEPAGDISQTVMGLGVFIFGFDELCEAGAGILVMLRITEGHAQIILRLRKIRLERDALAIGSNSFVKLCLAGRARYRVENETQETATRSSSVGKTTSASASSGST